MSRVTTPQIAVVIANHDNEAFVEHAIESVAEQTLQNLDVVIVDDASTDGSDAVIRRTLKRLDDRRFQYIPGDSNLGQGGAIRKGLERLTAPFVCFLDSDDLWYETFLARHLEAHLNADFPVALTYCDSHIIDAAGCIVAGTAWWFDQMVEETYVRPVDPLLVPTVSPERRDLTYPNRHALSLFPTWQSNWASNTTSGMMIRRSFADLMLQPAWEDLRLYVDFYFSTSAALLTGTIAIHDTLYAYRMHGSNKHSNGVVFGGAYNTSLKPWCSIRDSVFRRIVQTLKGEATTLQAAFGKDRYDMALTQMAVALGDEAGGNGSRSRNRLLSYLGIARR
jgi:glycosyltransferase involved in cell wall biosynthesis